ncbi:MAG: ISNCY family transposase [Candidatus Brocadiaceae bacterium]|nr:ISNCY family transposase [Candidatus Brocadiaceae bacterium]
MRNIAEIRTNLFNKSIESIKTDIHCRDEIPTILLGLQELYKHPAILNKVFDILDSLFSPKVNRKLGRPGLNLWQILVLGVVRLTCNCDYDKLSDLAGNHLTLRLFLHDGAESTARYPRQTLVDNLSRFTPEILEKVNFEIVKLGHTVCKSSGPKECRIDSFVVETDVHFPTDLSLIWDASRTLIRLTSKAATLFGINGWRESNSLKKNVKKACRLCQNVRSGKPRKEKSIARKAEEEKRTTKEYYKLVISLVSKVQDTILSLKMIANTEDLVKELEHYISLTELVASQLIRRVVNGEKIPHDEKIFSIFQPHTEWISKGKAGISQELGVRVAVAEDEYGFLIGWRTMFKETDDKVTVPMSEKVLGQFPTVEMFSFDKGFYSPANSKRITQMCDIPILPKKGKLTTQQKADTKKPQYIKFRHKHSRIESAINAIENHGLDRCRDHGKEGFQTYVGLAVIARNILQIGAIIRTKELKVAQKKRL